MFAPGQSRAAPCRAPGAHPMLSARIGSHRCAPWLLGRLGTLSGALSGGAAAGPLHAQAKRGAANSAPSGEDQAAEQGADASQQPQDPAAAAPDLSVHAPVGEQWQPATLPHQWVAFSDLHVSHKTRATALAVLERVHEEAAKRGAGILFLGACVCGMGGCCNRPVHLMCWVAACVHFEVLQQACAPCVGLQPACNSRCGCTGLCLSYTAACAPVGPLRRAGDFWHTRGTLPVEPLNEVVQQLAAWRQPTLMLPGNHDQVGAAQPVLLFPAPPAGSSCMCALLCLSLMLRCQPRPARQLRRGGRLECSLFVWGRFQLAQAEIQLAGRCCHG